MASNETPPSVDYTSRDYYALRDELIARVKKRVPDWNGSDSGDFGLALVEAFAYMGDIASYYIDRIANEGFLATATQRESILALAEVYGYTPSGYTNSTTTLKFTNNSNSAINIPAGTRTSGSVVIGTAVKNVYFTTDETVTVPAYTTAPGEIEVSASEGLINTVESGSIYGESLGVSDGNPSQTFAIYEDPVVSSSIDVYVQSGVTYKKWTQVKHLLDYSPSDSVYSVILDKDNIPQILFGDGISGAIPTLNATIRAVYVVGGGTIGNVAPSIIDTIVYIPGLSTSQTAAITGVVDVINTTVGLGGQEPESNTLIRANAPSFLSAQNRAVTLDDFQNLALSVQNCGKAKAISTGWTSVTMYLAPARDNTDADPTPGIDTTAPYDPTIEWTLLRDAVEEYLSDKLLAGTTVTYTRPAYVPVTMNIQYTLDPTFTQAVAETNIKTAITNNFAYSYIDFGAYLTAQDIEISLANIPGCARAVCQFLYKSGGSPSLSAIQALDNEILSFSEGDIILEKV